MIVSGRLSLAEDRYSLAKTTYNSGAPSVSAFRRSLRRFDAASELSDRLRAYLSESPAICEQEKIKQVANQPELLPPQVMGSIEVDVRDVLDLTEAANQKALGLSTAQLTDPLDLTFPQALAEAARALGINALLVPSAVAAGKNLVVFEDSLTRPACRMRILKLKAWPEKA